MYLSNLLLQCLNLIVEFIDVVEQGKVLVLNCTWIERRGGGGGGGEERGGRGRGGERSLLPLA